VPSIPLQVEDEFLHHVGFVREPGCLGNGSRSIHETR